MFENQQRDDVEKFIHADAEIRRLYFRHKELDSKLFIFEQAVGEALYAQQPPLEAKLGVEYDQRGNIKRDDEFRAIGQEGVFVAGDAGRVGGLGGVVGGALSGHVTEVTGRSPGATTGSPDGVRR